MYAWYYARKVNNKLVKFVDLKNYTTMLSELSEDENVPKLCTTSFT